MRAFKKSKRTKLARSKPGQVKSGRYQLVGGLAFIGRNDPRWAHYREVLSKTGISPDEAWNLDVCFGMFMEPRIRDYRNRTIGYPGTLAGGMDEWHQLLDKIADGLGLLANGEPDWGDPEAEDKNARIDEALKLFAEWIRGMWY